MDYTKKKTMFAKEVLPLCIERDVIPAQLATEIGVSKQIMSYILLGHQNVSDAMVDKIAQYFELDKEAKANLKYAAYCSRRTVRVSRFDVSEDKWRLLCDITWRLDSMTEEDVKKIHQCVKGEVL